MDRSTNGSLLIIGGAEDKKGERQILRRFVEEAGGSNARIIVMTLATELPEEVGQEYRRVFNDLGAGVVEPLDTSREDAGRRDTAATLRDATGVFFTGGEQQRIVEGLRGTKLDEVLRERLASGLVIGGTSAGASMMSDLMIIEGDSETHPQKGVVELGAGMGLLPGTVVDQHFAQRGRIGRLLYAVTLHRKHLGLGIDENTAMLVRGSRFEVIGEGAVSVVDGSTITQTNIDTLKRDDNLAVCGARLHVLPAGYAFDMERMAPATERSAG